MLELRCRAKTELARWQQLANYMQPLFKVPYVFAAKVIPYQEQWKRVTTIESYNCDWFVALFSRHWDPISGDILH